MCWRLSDGNACAAGCMTQEAMRNAFGFGGFGGGFQRTVRRGPAVVRTAMRISFDEAVKGTTKQVGGRAQKLCSRCWSQLGPRSRLPARSALHNIYPLHISTRLFALHQVDLSSLGRAFSGKTVEMTVPPGMGSHWSVGLLSRPASHVAVGGQQIWCCYRFPFTAGADTGMQLHLAGVLPGGQGVPPGDLIVQVSALCWPATACGL